MPKTAIPLNDKRIKAMKPKAKRYLVADGGGLALEVMTSGAKIWRYRYSLHSKQQPLVTIGEYPSVSLQDARDRARKYGETVSAGVSPVADAKKDRGAEKALDSVRAFADLWFESEIADKSKSYSTVTRRALDKDIYPAIGNKPLADVNAGDVLAICDKIKGRGAPQVALFTRNVVKRMYEYAISRQVATINPAQQLVARFIATPQSRTRVLSPDEVGSVMRTVYASDMSRAYKLALHLLVITMVRKSELIEAEWSEFDLDAGIWRIPASRMKKDVEHWVYLSAQAVDIIRELQTLSHSQRFLFPMRRGYEDRPIAKSTLNQAVRAMKADVQHFVIHDFRRTASTHLHEMGMSSDAIEKALAHSIKGIKGVYNRAEYADERRKILQLWASFVDAQINEGNRVIAGRFGKVAA
ncbi:tyrosine-type recombinase/integrase [Pseudoduganella namucuonensis]|uniref:Site-specific recombinase XerD n=1 Tax=Pseudoduganella namucuonensis TaxID=1035707 RepID=A0A1I7M0K5_9BURK|nr:tyrosine-type recombinase/integrase [Pseudoduganella namucuonensis]SFV15468.1 Site-specific recombinase XerD [Pseudoduganella namucuonensis]